ncbi:MAG: hypothetical protein H6754_00315 [Candidatus Omnitrophica bacterium]|nr:hypothetical protein [Candidatus Omnitrophota bacterium]
MMQRSLLIWSTSFFLFIVLMFMGLRIASQKPLWNDEIFSQISSVEQLSYPEIVLGRVGEGNATPLFYLTQKALCQTFNYSSPVEWKKGTKFWDFDRPRDRIILRIGPVLVVAFAITLIFLYFAQYHSFGAAFFSLFLALSCEMLLRYWAEARPYALWMSLTTMQILLFLCFIQTKKFGVRILQGLATVQILLSCTVVLSLPQILLVSFLLWVYGMRSWKYYLVLLVLPVIIGMIYYGLSPHYPFALIFTIEQYIRANISRDRFYVAILFILLLAFYGVQERLKLRQILDSAILKGLPALGIFLGAVAGACAILGAFIIKAGPVMQFPVTEKYFIFLVPVGIISVTVFTDVIIRAFKMQGLKFVMIIMIAGMTIPRAIKVVGEFLNQYPQIFS